MEGERIAFTEEGQPGQYLKLIASGDVDDTMLEALEDFVKRQRKRLAATVTNEEKAIVEAACRYVNWPTAEDEKELAANPDWSHDAWLNDGNIQRYIELIDAVRAAGRIALKAPLP